MIKGSKLYSILKFKCPECHKGNFFESHPYHFKTIGNIHHRCSHCGLKFSKEPGFYYGAMYVSYALGVAIFVSVFLIDYFLVLNLSFVAFLIIIGSLLVLGTPYLFHLSKIIWANLFFHFKSNKT